MTEAAGKCTALVVEDDDQIAYLLRFILEREGYAVKLASDGRSAQEFVSTKPVPAVVTLDVMLPQTDGFQLLAQMWAQPGWSDVPIQSFALT